MTSDTANGRIGSRCCTVLLVDDQRIVAEGIRRMLENEKDIQFHYCSDPAIAIQLASEVKPTVILQDLVMPDIDGMTLVRYYRANQETRNIPVIVLSSREEATTKRDAFTNGANDYLVKLPDQIELLARIRLHSRNYLTSLERDAAFHALREMQLKLEESNRELQRLTSLDGLTGIANRRHFDETLEKEWRRASRDDMSIALIMIDIDYFKQYNDNYGHIAGDECLKRVATLLKEALHRPADMLARYGGEEFAVILPDTDLEGARTVADNLHQVISAAALEHAFSQVSGQITVSQGIAAANASAIDNLTSLVETADRALYESKQHGRARYTSLQLDPAGADLEA